MKLLLWAFFFIFLIQKIEAKKKEIYKFVVEKKDTVPGMGGFYVGCNNEFTHTRIVYKDSVYAELNLLFNGSFVYKIKNGNGYFKKEKKWVLFYTKDKNLSTKFNEKIINHDFIFNIQNIGTDIVFGIPCVIYQLQNSDKKFIDKKGNSIVTTFTHTDTKYWFNPYYGFIKVSGELIPLYRQDILPK